jgi:hypothetical protein
VGEGSTMAAAPQRREAAATRREAHRATKGQRIIPRLSKDGPDLSKCHALFDPQFIRPV